MNEKTLKEYSIKTLRQCEQAFAEEVKQINTKIDDVKIENGKYHMETKKMIKELEKSLIEADRIKAELKELWEGELE